MLNAVFIFIGLSLDNFIVMMKKGASVRGLTQPSAALYSLICAAVNVLLFTVGYLISRGVAGFIPDGRMEFASAAVLINIIGVVVICKAYFSRKFEEKLDRNFNIGSLIRLAVITNIDTLIVGIGFSLFGISMKEAVLLAFGISFLTVYTGMNTGYSLGVGYQRAIGLCGGALMIVFSFLLFAKYVMR